MILYHASDLMLTELEESEKVQSHFQEAQQLTQMGCNHLERSVMEKVAFDICQFFHALTQMKNLFGTCKIQSGDNNDSSVPRTLEISITETEETWLKKRFCLFQEQFVSVVPNGYFIQEMCDLLGKGIPVSKSFSPQCMLILTERVRRALKIHPEFCNLPDQDQEMLWRKNKMHATAIVAARINSVRTGFHVINTLTCSALFSL